MRTTSADKFFDFVQNLDMDSRMNKGIMVYPNSVIQMAARDPYYQSLRVMTPDRSSETEFDQRDIQNRVAASS